MLHLDFHKIRGKEPKFEAHQYEIWRGRALRLRRSLSTLKAPSFTMADVHYELPESLIGVRPAARESKLLHYRGSEIEHRRFKDVVGLIPAGSVMIFNSSKVFNAQFMGGEASDPTEIMMLSPEFPSKDPAECYRQKVQGQVWNVVIRGGAVTSVDEGDVFECKTTSQAGASSMISIKVRKLYSIWEEHGELPGFEAAVEFMSEAKEQAETLAVCLDHVGTVPIPPYLNRSTIAQDSSDYQTVYADEEQTGSVAAPTAGLHSMKPSCLLYDKMGRPYVILFLSCGGWHLQARRIRVHQRPRHARREVQRLTVRPRGSLQTPPERPPPRLMEEGLL